MSDETLSKHDHVLAGLIMSLQAAALQQLGKITSPMTGQIERDLDQARHTIDLLEMLKVKCRAGTPDAVLRMMDQAVMDLQMNYVDERRRDAQQAQKTAEAMEKEKEKAGTAEETPDEGAQAAAEGEDDAADGPRA